MVNRRLSPRNFDNTQPLVYRRHGPIMGKEHAPGDVIDADLPHGTRMKLWLSGRAVYQQDFTPTPVEGQDAEQTEDTAWMLLDRGYTVDEGENGWYVLRPEGVEGDDDDRLIKAHGHDAAQTAVEDLRDTFVNKGVTIVKGKGGWYVVKAPWEDAPHKVKGLANAEAKRADLIANVPPPAEVVPEPEPTPEQPEQDTVAVDETEQTGGDAEQVAGDAGTASETAAADAEPAAGEAGAETPAGEQTEDTATVEGATAAADEAAPES